jgi:hypothetical protein
MKICGWARDARGHGIPVDADLQVEHDGLRLGVCLAIAQRLERFPNFTMQGLRTSLTAKQQAAVDECRARTP